MKSHSGAWRIKSGRTVYETAWVRIREYDAVAPTGAPAHYGMVSFRNLAVGVLPLDTDGSTWLVGQDRFVLGQYSWEVPEGGCPLHESPDDTAKRELAEETRLQARQWWPLFSEMHLSNSTTDERAFAWICWGLSDCEEHKQDDTEKLTLRRLPVGEAVQMAVNGQISDALSVVILLKADHLWRQGKLPEEAALAFAAGQIDRSS